MSSQQRIQAYMERHRISALFEDLMARLAHHLPAEPVPFLVKVLNKFDEKAKKPSGASPGKKSMTWAAASLPGMGTDRGYERPWTANMKKHNTGIGEVTSLRKPKLKPVARRPLSKTSSAGDADSLSRKSKAKNVGFTSSKEDLLDFSPPPRPPPEEAARAEAQFLAEEMSMVKPTKKTNEDKQFEPKEITAESVKERREKPGNKAKKHKQDLAKMVEAQLAVESLGYIDTGEDAGDPDSGGYEEATDLLEDVSDLMDEGVVGAKSSGQKARRRPAAREAEVKVTMCSKCARLVGSDDSSSTVGGGGYGKYASIDSFSEVSGADFAAARSSTSTLQNVRSDDEFESASQVSGPRQPEWEDDSHHEEGMSENGGGGTYRKGQRSTTPSSVGGQGWDPVSYGSDTEVTDREVKRQNAKLLEQGRSWAMPDSDEDSGY